MRSERNGSIDGPRKHTSNSNAPRPKPCSKMTRERHHSDNSAYRAASSSISDKAPSNHTNTDQKIKIKTKRRNLLKLTPIEAIDLLPAESGRARNIYCTLVLLDSHLREIRGEKHRTPPLRQPSPVWSPLKAAIMRSHEIGVESHQSLGIGAAAVAEEYTFGTISNLRKAQYLLIKCKDKGRMETDDLGRLLLNLNELMITEEHVGWYDLQLGHGGKMRHVQGKIRIATRVVREPSLFQLWACAEQMRKEVQSRDRSLYLKPHPCVITGKEATEWMLCHGLKRPMAGGISCSTEEEAILLGSSLIRSGILAHVTGSADSQRFSNSGWRYYRFAVNHLDLNKQRDAVKLRTLILSGKAEEEDEEEDSVNATALISAGNDEFVDMPAMDTFPSTPAPKQTESKSLQTLTSKGMDDGKSSSSIRIEDFELLKVLGTGSFGRVLSARGPDGKIYALKIISKIGLESAQRRNVKIERDILKRVDHPFVASLQFAFQNEDKLYLGMEYYNGGDLRHHLSQQLLDTSGYQMRFSESRIQMYAAELVAGLAHLHSMDIIYRDLKPENILIARDGHLVLVDFGLSKPDFSSGKAVSFAGSPEYIAPEVLSVAIDTPGKVSVDAYDQTCDWWSLGILIFEMFVGRTPFKDENTNIMYRNIREGQLFIPSSLPEHAHSLLQGLLERDYRKRLGANETVPFSIMNHVFFQNVDWDALQRKEYCPEWVPDVIDETDAKYIDNEFVNQIPLDTPEWRMLDSIDRVREYIPNFTFQPKVLEKE